MPEVFCLGFQRFNQFRMRMAERVDRNTSGEIEIAVAFFID